MTRLYRPTRTIGTASHIVKLLERHELIPVICLLFLICLAQTARAACQEDCLANGNTGFGTNVLLDNSGVGNTAIGDAVLPNNTNGNFNTGLGFNALFNNTTGTANTAVGASALVDNTTGSNNTAIGAFALEFNEGADNTAIGTEALLENTTGTFNTATGSGALSDNTTGGNNTASGASALLNNTTGDDNTATGVCALCNNTTGDSNTATGNFTLSSNSTGSGNTATGANVLSNNATGNNNSAFGVSALANASTGSANTALGFSALLNDTNGSSNTAVGINALLNNTTGASNIALGVSAGSNLTTGTSNIDIGAAGLPGESKKIRVGTKGTQTATFIAGINGVTVAGGVNVIVNSNGQLGTVTSSARYKENIQPMDKASEAILSLKPVTFHYKKDLDPQAIPQFGLVAEQVEKVAPDLVARDEQGKPYTVRYDAVNAMLLNEFLKEHRRGEAEAAAVAELKSTVAAQQEQIQSLRANLKEQAGQILKLSDRIELTNSQQIVSSR